MINKSTTQRNYKRLVEYDLDQQHAPRFEGARKATFNLDQSYQDVIKRISLIEGTTKTEIIRRALDSYSEQFGDEVLFPSQALHLVERDF